MGKYWGFFRNTLASSFEYRGEFIMGIIHNLLSIFGGLIFWVAIYRSNTQVAGYKVNDIILYYLLMPVMGALTYVTVSERLPKYIKDGKLSSQLIKPYKIWLSQLIETAGGKISYIVVVLPFYLAIFWLISGSYRVDVTNQLPAAMIVFGALSLHFFMDLAVSWLTFWFDEVWSFRHFKNILLSVLGGLGFPLDLFPPQVKHIIDLLPFQYFYYVPISYLTDRRGVSMLAMDLLGIAFWTILFVVLGKVLWNAGMKKYGAYGN